MSEQLSPQQLEMVKRAIEIQQEQRELKIELSTIIRELGYQGINVWNEIRKIEEGERDASRT